MNEKVYLAIPYTGIEELSFKVANYIAAQLMHDGFIVFSPISHSHHIAAQNHLEFGWNYWKRFDESFIDWCDFVFVVMLLNWKNSIGVKGEINIANNVGKKIKYIDPRKYLYVQELIKQYGGLKHGRSQLEHV